MREIKRTFNNWCLVYCLQTSKDLDEREDDVFGEWYREELDCWKHTAITDEQWKEDANNFCDWYPELAAKLN